MSWSFSAVGKPAAVIAKMKADLARSKCVEPEETHKNTVVTLVETMLSAYSANVPVSVDASGSQSTPDSTKPSEHLNQLTLKVQPVWGFLDS